jgi:hypothetical protein
VLVNPASTLPTLDALGGLALSVLATWLLVGAARVSAGTLEPPPLPVY